MVNKIKSLVTNWKINRKIKRQHQLIELLDNLELKHTKGILK